MNVANMCSDALRKEHENDSSSVKHIEAKTRISGNTISKWYRAINAPKSAHLLVLAAIYPEVLKGLLFIIGREDIWRFCLLNNIPAKMERVHDKNGGASALYSDKYVHIDVVLNREFMVQLNQRQLWFLGELQQERSVRANEIAEIWKKTLRTTRRDIQEIMNLGLIEHCGAQRNGHYRLLE